MSSTQTVTGIKSAKMLTDTITTHGVFVGGKTSRCLSVLGAGQIDKYGNINSSRTWDGSFLVGTGGSNDAANAREAILVLKQSKERFVETLAYITAKGHKVSKVISTMGVFKKASGSAELCLAACFPDQKELSMENRVEKVKNHCGWPLRTAEDVRLMSEPAPDELQLLRSLLNNHVT
jgi:3-oxoacid CoA-transferase subunit A